MNRVKDKVALITGAGGGIGRATCELLAKEGAKIVATGHNMGSVEETANIVREAGGDVLALRHDVGSEEDWARVIDQTLEHFNTLDTLVNNAAIAIFKQLKDVSLQEWHKVLNVNLDSVFFGTRAAINIMKDSPHKGGSIINISSISGLLGTGGRLAHPVFQEADNYGNNIAPYCASKGGLTLLTKATAGECGRLGYNIRVNSIHPGTVMVDTFKPTNDKEILIWEEIKRQIPIGRVGKPIEIANGVLFLASDESSFMTGSELVMDGGYTAV